MVDVGAMIRDWRCRRFAAALVDYNDGALSAAERARIDRHLAGCPRCAPELTSRRTLLPP